jgi:hypothetical protein
MKQIFYLQVCIYIFLQNINLMDSLTRFLGMFLYQSIDLKFATPSENEI